MHATAQRKEFRKSVSIWSSRQQVAATVSGCCWSTRARLRVSVWTEACHVVCRGRGTAKSINLGRCLQLIDSSRPVQRAILKSDHLVVLPTHPCRATPGHRQRALTRPPTDDSGDLPLFCAEIRYDALLTVYFVSYAQVTA